jgi:UDP-N-acetylmuramoyl-tripeptide--D-alanyl-D-alanine ligase
VTVAVIGVGDPVPVQLFVDAVLGLDEHNVTGGGDAELTVDYDGHLARVFRDGHELPTLKVSDVEASLSDTSFTVVGDGVEASIALRVIGERQVPIAVAAILVGAERDIPMNIAIDRLERIDSLGQWRMNVITRSDGATIINDAHDADYDDMAYALKLLAQSTNDRRRSVAVLGEFRADDADRIESHDAIGRLVVRLNIDKLIAVGHGARHIQSAAGLEGSWDGESVIVADKDRAYDLLRDEIREGDVVLVKAAKAVELGSLGDSIGGVTPW